MAQRILLGLVAAFFFGITFVVIRAIGIEGGHWAWSGVLRYGFMVVLLSLWLFVRAGKQGLAETHKVFRRHWLFWTLAGSLGFGGFYALLPFWVVSLLVCVPTPPSGSQVINSLIIAITAGVIATSIFYYARKTNDAYAASAVDAATMGGEVPFAVASEMLIFGIAAPGIFGFLGIGIITTGLLLYVRHSRKSSTANSA